MKNGPKIDRQREHQANERTFIGLSGTYGDIFI